MSLTADPSAGFGDQEVSGVIDTEARMVLDLVPDRFSLLPAAVAPTGIEALEVEGGAILTALSSQVIGFSTTRLGGGAGGAGFRGCPSRRGDGSGSRASYTHSLAYTPVLGPARGMETRRRIQGQGRTRGDRGATELPEGGVDLRNTDRRTSWTASARGKPGSSSTST